MTLQTKYNPLYYIVPSLIVALIIFYLSCLMTPSDVPEVEFDFFIPADKLVHFCMYFGLAGITAFSYIYLNKGKVILLRILFFAIILPIAYGGILEILQGKYFDRTADWFDFLANSLGAIATIPFSLWLIKIVKKKSHHLD